VPQPESDWYFLLSRLVILVARLVIITRQVGNYYFAAWLKSETKEYNERRDLIFYEMK
jgi:hypothetical protein